VTPHPHSLTGAPPIARRRSRDGGRRAILDEGVRVRPGARVGFDPDADRRRGFVPSAAGITCVPKGTVIDGE
jgi:hypothetical protein